jgi:hypothetical protein
MTGRRRSGGSHHTSGGSPTTHHGGGNSGTTTAPRHHGGGGSGVGTHLDGIDTMASRLDATRGRVQGVAGTLSGVNVGPQSMGVVGSGFTGAAQAHLRVAEQHMARTTEAVEQAHRGTRGTAQAYRDTDAANAAALNSIDTTSTPPTTHASATTTTTTPSGSTTTTSTPSAPPTTNGGPGGGGPPPPPPPPPGGGGAPPNNLGHAAGPGELDPQYPRHVINTAPTSTDQQIRDIAQAKGYDPDQHIPKTQTPTDRLSHDDRVEVADVRNGIPVNPGEVMTKVVKPELADALLRNETSYVDADTGKTSRIDPDQLGGSVARGSDTAQYDRPGDFREKLGLDDGGAGWSPVKAGAGEAYQLRFPAPDKAGALDVSFGSTNPVDAADMQAIGGSSQLRAWNPPFLGTGYTDGGHTGSGMPEWMLNRDNYNNRTEMWEVRADGTEHLVGVNLPGRGWFDLRP